MLRRYVVDVCRQRYVDIAMKIVWRHYVTLRHQCSSRARRSLLLALPSTYYGAYANKWFREQQYGIVIVYCYGYASSALAVVVIPVVGCIVTDR